ncbi:MAG: dTMP kinase [Candidatus Neomarinimicrobiota bacterium]|jgi:dTMP kinase|nr:dTMP kinase [Candidatus Neomarinimicrobiota bacterium]MDD3966604.1 dTMP kinase [Candidatus Neomarinimicrobiota bacterium]MDX9780040.1 dTMP kinase [bacterium]
MFISFEGIDGSGKSVQARLCVDYLAARFKTVHCFDPGHTVIGNAVRNILLNREHGEMNPRTELLLYAAARSQLVTEVILPVLKEGGVVVSDRFYDSTTAYQGYGRELPLDLIRRLNRIGAHELVPDLTFIIDTDPEIAAGRIGDADRLESESAAFKMRVRNGYRRIAEQEAERCRLINGNRSIAEIHAEIRSIIDKKLAKMPDKRAKGFSETNPDGTEY